MAFKQGLTLSAFEELQAKAKKDAKVFSAEVSPEHAKAVQDCISTTPPPNNEPDPSWP